MVQDGSRTSPLFAAHRAVLVRRVDKASPGVEVVLLESLPGAPPEVAVVVTSDRAPSPKLRAVLRSAARRDVATGNPSRRREVVSAKISAAPQRFTAQASRVLAAHFGEDVGRLAATLDTLLSAYGPGAAVDVSDLDGYLGEPGQTPAWDLTDPIAAGDAATALRALERMLAPGGKHPLVVLTIIRNYYAAVLRLASSGCPTDVTVSTAILGGGSPFTVKKLVSAAKQLGLTAASQAADLVLVAEANLKGSASATPDQELTVLVGRLAALSASSRSRSTVSV